MDTKTAIEQIKRYLENEYRPRESFITALDLATTALSKQVPMQVNREFNTCPQCQSNLMLQTYAPFCQRCGQAIDWSKP